MSEKLNKYRIMYREIFGNDFCIYAKSSEDAFSVFEWMSENLQLVGPADYMDSTTASTTTESGSFDEKEIKTDKLSNGFSIVTQYDKEDNLSLEDSVEPVLSYFNKQS